MAPRQLLLLCADDYALTEGVSRAIEELSAAGRISATSAIVTSRHWPAHGGRLASLRDSIAIGLHLNLTLGSPLGRMPGLAPEGQLPTIGDLTRRAIAGTLDPDEIAEEALRQLAEFEAQTGFAPDFVDGHQHVHALPLVRSGVLSAMSEQFPDRRMLIRNPSSSVSAIVRRASAVPKALTIAWLSRGFGHAVRKAGFMANDSFAGVSDFRPADAARDFARANRAAGPLHLIMCHPGHMDEELANSDPIAARRPAEYQALMHGEALAPHIWRPRGGTSRPTVDWRSEQGGRA